MRYTTILDLRDWPLLYKNHNVRLLYLHLVLIARYEDTYKDWAKISIRKLAVDSGLTESACRHALKVLEKAKLIRRRDGWIWVAKWLKEPTITPRQRKSVGTITTDTTRQENRQSSIDQLKSRAAAGDAQAADLLKRFFKQQ